jgi:hypothetical protein
VIVIYGPEVQGSRNNEIKIHTKNAQIGEVIPDVILNIAGFHAFGTSKANHHLPYQKASFKLKSHTKIQSVHAII